MDDIVGFGHVSTKVPTTTRNAHVRVTTIPVDGGADVVIEALGKRRVYPQAEVSSDGRSCTIHLSDYDTPRIGQRVCIGRMLAKVAGVRFDDSGHCFVIDEDTGAQLRWPGDEDA